MTRSAALVAGVNSEGISVTRSGPGRRLRGSGSAGDDVGLSAPSRKRLTEKVNQGARSVCVSNVEEANSDNRRLLNHASKPPLPSQRTELLGAAHGHFFALEAIFSRLKRCSLV